MILRCLIFTKKVTKMINKFEKLHGKVKALRGKLCEYLGMKFDFTMQKKPKIGMTEYTKEALSIFPGNVSKKVNATTADHLFNVNGDAENMSEKEKQNFHMLVTRNPFASKYRRL